MGEYQIIAMAAGMFFEFGIKDFYQRFYWYSGFYFDMAGGDSGIGNEAFGFYFQYIDECGCVGLDCIVSG